MFPILSVNGASRCARGTGAFGVLALSLSVLRAGFTELVAFGVADLCCVTELEGGEVGFAPPNPENPFKRALPWPDDISTSVAKVPFSIIFMRFESSVMNSIFCSTKMMVRPFLRLSVFRISPISSTIEGWMPSVGSSSKIRSGSEIKHRARARICCSPPDSVPPERSSRLSRRGNSNTIFRIASSSSIPCPTTPMRKLSNTLRFGKIPRP